MIDCVALLCTSVALKDGQSVWFMPTDMESLQCEGFLKAGEEGTKSVPDKPINVFVPVMVANGHCILVIFKVKSCTLEVYDTAPSNDMPRNPHAALVKKKV